MCLLMIFSVCLCMWKLVCGCGVCVILVIVMKVLFWCGVGLCV